MEQDFEVERCRDEARAAAAGKVREAQAAWVPNLNRLTGKGTKAHILITTILTIYGRGSKRRESD
eukprot:3175876-Pyramimonas_sp.AAC.1